MTIPTGVLDVKQRELPNISARDVNLDKIFGE
jgi:hypothetical protein